MISSWRSRIRSCSRSRVADALGQRGARPGGLRPAGPGERLGDVGVARTAGCAPAAAPFSGECTSTVSPVVDDDAPGQRLDVVRLEGVRRRRVVLGVVGAVEEGAARGGGGVGHGSKRR